MEHPELARDGAGDEHGEQALDKIAEQRQKPRAHAEYARSIRSAGVAAAAFSHVVPENIFRYKNGSAERTEQIAQNGA